MDNQDFHNISNMTETPMPPSFGSHYYTNAPQRNFDPKKLILFIVGGVVVLALLICGVTMYAAKKKQCSVEGCTRDKAYNSEYCYAHKCAEYDCSKQKVSGKEYCRTHQEIKDKEAEEKRKNEIWGEALDYIQGDWEILSTVGTEDSGWIPVDGNICITDRTYSTTLIVGDTICKFRGNLDFGRIENNETYLFNCTDISREGTQNRMICIIISESLQELADEKPELMLGGCKYLFFALGKDENTNISFAARQRKKEENDILRSDTEHSPTTTISTKTTTSTKTGYATDALNVRRDASTNHDRVGLLKKGAAVTIVGEENGFYKIEYSWKQNGSSGQYAYVSKDYVTLKKPSSSGGGGNSNSGGNSGSADSNNGGGNANGYSYDDNSGGGNAKPAPAPAPTTTQYRGKTVTGQVSLPAVTDSSKLEMVFGYASAKRKDTVYIPVYVTNNPGVWGMSLDLKYDTNVLDLVDAKLQEPFASQLNQLDMLFDAKEMANVTSEGQILWLIFKVKENAPSGNTYINASTDDCIDVDGNDIRAIFHNGCIMVS